MAIGQVLRKHSKALSVIFVMGWLCLLGWQLSRDWGSLPEGFLSNVRYGWLLISVGLLLLALLATSLRWWLTLRVMHVSIPWWTAVEIWFLSQLGRYVPGGVWSYVGRFYLGRTEMRQDVVITSMVLETGLRVVSEILVFLLTLPFWPNIGFLTSFPVIPLLAGVIGGVTILHPRILQAVGHSPYLQRFGAKLESIDFSTVRYRMVLLLLAYYILTVIAVGVAFYMLVGAFYPASPVLLPALTGSLSASVVLGFLVPFAPNGLGVREGLLVFLLSQMIPASVAVILSIATRIWLSVAEGLWIVAILGLRKALKRH